jgi:hypothetical protein
MTLTNSLKPNLSPSDYYFSSTSRDYQQTRPQSSPIGENQEFYLSLLEPEKYAPNLIQQFGSSIKNYANEIKENPSEAFNQARTIVSSLVGGMAESFGLTDIFDGLSSGDPQLVFSGIGKALIQVTDFASVVELVDAVKKGDWLTVATCAVSVGIAVGTMGQSNIAKSLLKAATKEGLQLLAKETSTTMLKALGNELKESLAKHFSGATLQQAMSQVGTEIRTELIDALKKLPQETLDQLKDGSLTTELKRQLEEMIRNTSKEITEKHIDGFISKLDLNETLPKVTEKALGELIEGKNITKFLKDKGLNDKQIADLLGDLTNPKLNQAIVDELTEKIHTEFTQSIRDSFTDSLEKDIAKVLKEDLSVPENLQKELTVSWHKAALEGFEEGLTPIKKLIREGVQKAIDNRNDENDEAVPANAIAHFARKSGIEQFELAADDIGSKYEDPKGPILFSNNPKPKDDDPTPKPKGSYDKGSSGIAYYQDNLTPQVSKDQTPTEINEAKHKIA